MAHREGYTACPRWRVPDTEPSGSSHDTRWIGFQYVVNGLVYLMTRDKTCTKAGEGALDDCLRWAETTQGSCKVKAECMGRACSRPLKVIRAGMQVH